MSPIWYGAMDEKRLAFQAAEALPHIFTKQFFDIFINIGGSRAVRSKSKQMKQLSRLALGPACFNLMNRLFSVCRLS